MNSRFFLFFALMCVVVMAVEAGTIHSSLGTGETNRGWKPGGKRALDCFQAEALFTILEVVRDEVHKISSCERINLDDKLPW